ncbi:ATP-binding protein [Kitasatospora viridis]|uniref:DNA replication protein DnaC n=1 Tax=Kitasatospora viridis TaxID=281105 RepID=A0A561SAC6_9ACTN|nr:ATP-binding protein [Kitasatospora viridis]TWF71797.1 DNA replication protein DnaC [Kitasatospora viridis]
MTNPLTPAPAPRACKPLSNHDFARLRAARPRLWLDPTTSCVTCLKQNGNTYRWWDYQTAPPEVATWNCSCTDQWLMHLWMLNAGIGLAYQRLDWEDATAVPEHVRDQIMQYAVNGARNIAQGRNLILWSPDAGTGKTLLLTLLAKALMAQARDVFTAQFNSIIDLFTGGWRDETERAEWNRRVHASEVLAIDDLGKEHKGRLEMVESMVDQVIRSRAANSQPVILTTNLTPHQIQDGYGGYVMSLLSEQSDFIEVSGADFRPRRREISRQEADLGLTRPITVV